MSASRRQEHERHRAVRRRLGIAGALAVMCGTATPMVFASAVAEAGTPAQTAYVSESSTAPDLIDAFDTSSGSWLAQDIPTGGAYPAAGVAIAPDGSDVYVTGSDFEGATNGSLSVIATGTGTALAQIALPESPIGPIAVTPNGATAYMVAYRDVVPVDLSTRTVGTPISIPITAGGGDLGIAISTDGKTAYVPTSEMGPCTSPTTCYGVVFTIDLTDNTVGPQIDVPDYVGTWPDGSQEVLSGGIAIAPKGAMAYVVFNGTGVQEPGWVTPIETGTDTVESPIPAGVSPSLIVITPNGKTAYVNNSFSNNAVTGVTPIDLTTDTAEAQIPRPACPSGSGSYLGPMAIVPSGATLYLMCTLTSQLVPIDTATNTAGSPTASPSTYGTATGIAIVPDQAPTARFTATPAPSGSHTRFNASSSSSPVGTIVSYAWKFGDGTSATTTHPKVTHTYATAGTFAVTLTVVNSQGTSTKEVFTGNTMSNNGGPSAKVTEHVAIAAA
jgi:DNA-binding beta-propeller fold protein YncE